MKRIISCTDRLGQQPPSARPANRRNVRLGGADLRANFMLTSAYYSLSAIETDANTIPCTFQIDAAALGYLQYETADQHGARPSPVDDEQQVTTLPAGTTLHLPLWLALPLVKRGMVSVQLPSYLSHRASIALLADPTQANLAERCPDFYNVGLILSRVFDRTDLRQMLQRSLKSRFERILEQAQLFGDERADVNGITPFKYKLAENEKQIFQCKFEAQAAYRQWKDRDMRQNDQNQAAMLPRKKPKHSEAEQ